MHICVYVYICIYICMYIQIYVYICVCMNTPGFLTWEDLTVILAMGDPVVFYGVSNVGDPIVGYGCYQSTHVRDAMAFPRAGLRANHAEASCGSLAERLYFYYINNPRRRANEGPLFP